MYYVWVMVTMTVNLIVKKQPISHLIMFLRICRSRFHLEGKILDPKITCLHNAMSASEVPSHGNHAPIYDKSNISSPRSLISKRREYFTLDAHLVGHYDYCQCQSTNSSCMKSSYCRIYDVVKYSLQPLCVLF